MDVNGAVERDTRNWHRRHRALAPADIP